MKKYRKLFALGLTTLLVGSAFVAFSACATPSDSSSSDSASHQVAVSTDELVVFTVTSDVMELTETTSMYDYMVRLQALGEMTFDGYTGDYGYTLTAVNGTTTKFTADDYWSVYVDFTTLPDDETIYASEGYEWEGVYYSMTYEYGDVTLYGANYGVSGMPAVEGQMYALVLVH